MSTVPASVSFVRTTLLRGKEVEQKEPAIAYFCKLHAVQEVLATKLHTQDDEVKQFAADLLSDIEAAKESEALSTPEVSEIVHNDEVAQAYTQAFATSVFERAARAVDERRATKATAQTFIAAVTFLELQQIWGDLDEETRQQIKYAKFEAARILRALKAGEDPNAQEPETETPELPETPGDDPVVLPSTPAEPPDVSLPSIPDAQPNDLGLPRTPGTEPSVPFDYDAPPQVPKENDFTGSSAAGSSTAGPSAESASAAPAAPAASPQAAPPRAAPPRAAPKAHINIKSVMAEAATTTTAQKHAKYAISALNYDDVDTAISELTKALSILRDFKSR